MNKEFDCTCCGIEYEIIADDIVIRDEIEAKFCPFCGTSEEDLQLGVWDEDE